MPLRFLCCNISKKNFSFISQNVLEHEMWYQMAYIKVNLRFGLKRYLCIFPLLWLKRDSYLFSCQKNYKGRWKIGCNVKEQNASKIEVTKKCQLKVIVLLNLKMRNLQFNSWMDSRIHDVPSNALWGKPQHC